MGGAQKHPLEAQQPTMFTNVSMTGVGVLIYVLKSLLSYFGVVDIDDTQLERAISGTIDVVTLAMAVIGQLRRKDLKLGLARR